MHTSRKGIISKTKRSASCVIELAEKERNMQLRTLQEHIRTLATLEETESPVISFYASLHGNDAASKDFMRERLTAVQSSFAGPHL
jgi:hypothetical protein